MRLIHDVDVPMNPSAGGRLDRPDKIELWACTSVAVNHPDIHPINFDGVDEIIEIHGNVKYVKDLLQGWLNCIESHEAVIADHKAKADHGLPA